jgi:hypothetical protein
MPGFKTAQRTFVLTVATTALAGVATFATAGVAAASGASGADTAFPPPNPGAVLIKETTTAAGVFRFYKLAGPPQAATEAKAGNAAVSPFNGSGCNGINPQVCFTVGGSGFYVNYMENNTWYGASTNANIQIKNPSGGVVDEENEYVNPGWYQVDWAPRDYEAGGWWCGFSNGNGSVYTGSCVDVHN